MQNENCLLYNPNASSVKGLSQIQARGSTKLKYSGGTNQHPSHEKPSSESDHPEKPQKPKQEKP
ncbi:hypothetical protein E4U10_001793 [Claviceps purpurea]|nr:hypothetical protein E4U10_001793 [Claviceps purpurea]